MKPQTPQDPVPSKHNPQQPRPSLPTSGSQTKARALGSGGSAVSHIKNPNNTPTSVSARSQAVVSCSVAISAVTEPDSTQEVPSSSSTPGTPPRKSNKRRKKKACICHLVYIYALTGHHIKQVQKAEDPVPETTLPQESVSSERESDFHSVDDPL